MKLQHTLRICTTSQAASTLTWTEEQYGSSALGQRSAGAEGLVTESPCCINRHLMTLACIIYNREKKNNKW
jgi:hypothetical protein